MPLHHILAGILTPQLPHFSIAAPNPHGANEAARSSWNPRIVIFSLLPPLGPTRPQSPKRDSRIFFILAEGVPAHVEFPEIAKLASLATLHSPHRSFAQGKALM